MFKALRLHETAAHRQNEASCFSHNKQRCSQTESGLLAGLGTF